MRRKYKILDQNDWHSVIACFLDGESVTHIKYNGLMSHQFTEQEHAERWPWRAWFQSTGMTGPNFETLETGMA